MKDKDLLDKYINPEMMEKAPEDFTSKVMTGILSEKASFKKATLRNSIRVPLAVLTSAILLISLSVIFSPPDDNPYLTGISNVVNNLNLQLPDFYEGLFNNLQIPGLFIYISVGLLFLLLFDFGLNRLFHRKT